MSTRSPDQTGLLKLSREQLKQLCRERGHTSYSKCTKPQLVTLLGSDTPSKFNPSMMSTALPPKQDASSSASVSKKRPGLGSSGPGESISKKQKRSHPILPGNVPSIVQPPAVPAPSKSKRKPPFAEKLSTTHDSSAPPMPITPTAAPLPDQQPNFPSVSRHDSSSVLNRISSLPQTLEPATRSQSTSSSGPHNRVREEQESGTPFPAPDRPQLSSGGNGCTRPSKKFLDPRNGVASGLSAYHGPRGALPSTSLPTISAEPLPPPYLDSSVVPIPVLGLIGMLPSISDRKKAQPWSIILSGISNAERRTCTLVSRTFRYAGKSAPRSFSLGSLSSMLR